MTGSGSPEHEEKRLDAALKDGDAEVKGFHLRPPYRNRFPVQRMVEESSRPRDRKEVITNRRRSPMF